ncbi:uncharacterized protein Z518_11334 [Rhinocladiella mackenziei CBS 650.93]|uniref:CSN8/PSMD8/EIF3K domain-containing protein n=1 Tax=Rhinocladiella mackenziei CBS 650.93 TaxID=1442369 RepID=A0A0D2FB63_9EURO|nr:uncharacterized protein Z518_11334 [Rhinocladiella mackenziei CBS 650.93]KIW99346.1 hypothetical protein Z518_11334 [Rhinocladiella mackenziei CBS 650.93]
MAQPLPSLGRRSWDRLRPVKQDPLESMGFVSKGDNRSAISTSRYLMTANQPRLLDPKTQESFYNKIVARYTQFCTRYSSDLDSAFASLSLDESRSASTPSPSAELSTILLALRKLREGLLAGSASTPSPVFSQRVHVFNIRAAILALHPPGYHASLLHLLFVLHTPAHPLPRPELVEMTTYLILDTAIRQNDLPQAYALRYNSRIKFGFQSRIVDSILKSIVMADWVTFWRVRQNVDGYVRAILYWHIDHQRKMVLKAIGRCYYNCDIKWILQCSTGGELSWEELVKLEGVSWIREGDKVVIRKSKSNASTCA